MIYIYQHKIGKSVIGLFLSLVITLPINLLSQQAVVKENKTIKPIKFNGGINLSTSIFNGTGNKVERNPFGWGISANATVSIYGWSIPFSMAYSKNSKTFSHPFIRYGVSPKYKSLKLHLGYRNLSFSNYAYTGIPIYGAGFEFKPKRFYIGFMMGRINQKTNFDTMDVNYNRVAPRYARYGYGVKVGVQNTKSSLYITYFNAADRVDSLQSFNPKFRVRPATNSVLSASTTIGIKRFYVGAEGALSIYTRDRNFTSADTLARSLGEKPLPSWVKSIDNRINGTTQLLAAYEAFVGVNLKYLDLRLKYKRVNPDYKTMGTFYFQADNQQITIDPTIKVSEKLTIEGNFGLQSDNLLKKSAQTSHNTIYALNISFVPSERFQSTFNFSNYGTDVNSTQDHLMDSISVRSISKSIGLSGSYIMKKTDEKSQNITFNLQQQTNNEVFEYNAFEGSVFKSMNGNINYSNNNNVTKFLYGIGVNYNLNRNSNPINRNELIDLLAYGASFTLGKSWMKDNKLSLSNTLTINQMGETMGDKNLSFSNRLNGRILITKKQNLNLGLGFNTGTIRTISYHQFSINASYGHQF